MCDNIGIDESYPENREVAFGALSQEEVAFIQYYMGEMGKRFDGLFSKLEVGGEMSRN